MFAGVVQVGGGAPDDSATGAVSAIVTTPTGSATSHRYTVAVRPVVQLVDSMYAAGVILTPNGSGRTKYPGPTPGNDCRSRASHFEVADDIQQCIPQLCQYRDVVEATSSRSNPV